MVAEIRMLIIKKRVVKSLTILDAKIIRFATLQMLNQILNKDEFGHINAFVSLNN